jgi:putative ABC transport system permease protein
MTPPDSVTPSPLAERLLGAVFRHDEWREAVLGDLREEFASLARARGAAHARRWHWQQVMRIGGSRLVGRSVPVARGKVDRPAEPEPQGAWASGFRRDVSYAARSLARRPGLSAVIVVVLALGLAANATIFSVADAIVLRPFRFPAVDRLVVIASVAPHEYFDALSVSPADFLDWKAELRSVTDLAAAEWWEPNLVGRDEPEQLAGFRVTPRYLEALGVQPVVGRTFLPDEGIDGRHRRAVIGHSLWARRFGSDPAIVGQTLRLDGEPYEVVGVAPPGFKIPLGAEIWSPLVLGAQAREDRTSESISVIGRLAPGSSVEQAASEIATIVARQREQYPDTNGKRSVALTTFTRGMADPGAVPFGATFQVAAFLLLLVACANVANLLLARGVERQQEFAVRLALGASRGRIARQLLLEGAAFAGAALILAVPLAWAGVSMSRMALPPSIIRFVPGWEYLSLQPRALVATSALAAVAMLVFSLAPALQGMRAALGDTLRQSGRTMTAGRSRTLGRAMLASTQIALTLALLTASALAISAARTTMYGDNGFDPNGVLVGRLLLPNNPYDDAVRRHQFVDTVLERLRAVPAVQSAAATSSLPFGSRNSRRPLYPEGVELRPADVRSVDFRRITPELFEVLRIPLLAGRTFGPIDRPDTTPVAIVSRALADQYWPGQDPIGRRIRLAEDGPWLQVVGVVGDVTQEWFRKQRNPTLYRASQQDPAYNVNFVVRIAGDPSTIAGDLRRAVAAADPEQPIRELRTYWRIMDDRTAGLSWAATWLTVVGGIALLLALVGIYSLMAYLCSRRTQEIGVRLAFGATRQDVIRLTVAQASRITAAGITVGIVLAAAVGQAMQATLFGSVEANFALSGALAVTLAAAALVASYLPARRAAALDPTVALRE